MPMYEFFCRDCNTVFTFFSRTVNTEKTPACPKCRRPGLERMVSRFAVTGRVQESGAGDDKGEGPGLPVSGERMEKAMEALASEAEGVDENNPQAAAGLMRRFSDITGIRFGDKMENAVSRLEAGEDPESLEKDLEGIDENDLFKLDGAGEAGGRKATGTRRKAPLRDETLYEM
jgi:putative FmdB family regulatory protein